MTFQNADIGLGAVAMMAERERVLDFTFPFYEGVGFLLLMKKIYLEPSLFRFESQTRRLIKFSITYSATRKNAKCL